jgi:hypothetical protein
MSHVQHHGNREQTLNYFVRDAGDGNLEILRCSSALGYPTAAAAKDAKIKEMQEEMRFHFDTIGGLLNDIKRVKAQQRKRRLYCEINGFMDEIEKDRQRQNKVTELSF